MTALACRFPSANPSLAVRSYYSDADNGRLFDHNIKCLLYTQLEGKRHYVDYPLTNDKIYSIIGQKENLMAYIYKREPLTAEETDRLVNSCQTGQEKLFIFGLLETGLRISEFCALTPQNFRWQEGYMVVEGKGGPFGKLSKKRSIPLSERAKTIFTAWFTVNDKIPCTARTVERIVKKIANRANITRPCCPHVLRHTFACNCLRKGVHLVTVNKMLGHDHIETTMIYANLFPEDVKNDFLKHW